MVQRNEGESREFSNDFSAVTMNIGTDFAVAKGMMVHDYKSPIVRAHR